MQSRNPYEPPRAEPLERATPAAVERMAATPLQYAGFWRRFFAYWIDVLVFLPAVGLTYALGELSRMFYLYWFVPGLVVGLLFHVYLVKRYGGTPGKLVLKTRVALVDGSSITTKAAMVRYSVLFVLSALSSLALLMSTLTMTDELYFSLGYLARSQKMIEMAPSWYFPVSVLVQVWVWGEFVTMLFNKKRRALHDYMAGTVVVRSVRRA
jgi:uncharacterized RDD family membrane protein YckC